MAWSVRVPLHEAQRNPVRLTLAPSAENLAEVARQLALPSVQRLDAEVTVKPWLDGAEVSGRWSADLTQTCGVTLDPFPVRHDGEFCVRVVPPGSPAAPSEDPEVMVDLDADDPPDVLEGADIDVAAYVVEHLALELDPYPRAPGVEYEAPDEDRPPSPFAVLSGLKPN